MVEFIIYSSILALIAYLLFFKYELVYKIIESWKSYSSSDCSDLYKLDCHPCVKYWIHIFSNFQSIFLLLF